MSWIRKNLEETINGIYNKTFSLYRISLEYGALNRLACKWKSQAVEFLAQYIEKTLKCRHCDHFRYSVFETSRRQDKTLTGKRVLSVWNYVV